MLEVGVDSAKDDADSLQGVKCLAEALVPWLTAVLPAAPTVAPGGVAVSLRAARQSLAAPSR